MTPRYTVPPHPAADRISTTSGTLTFDCDRCRQQTPWRSVASATLGHADPNTTVGYTHEIAVAAMAKRHANAIRELSAGQRG